MRISKQYMCIQILIRDGGWLPTYEFQNKHGIFLGHRGPARISEIATEYENKLIEIDRRDKVFKYRFLFDTISQYLPELPVDLRILIKEELRKAGRHWTEQKQEVERVEIDGRLVARLVTREVMC